MSIQSVMIILLVGLAAGILSGSVGVGGGIIIVPALVYFLGFDQHRAQGTSLGLLMLPVGFLAVFNYYKKGHVDFKIIGILCAGFIIGGFLGSKLALNLPESAMKKVFAVLMMVIAGKMLFFDK
jgi:uncharacterized protein